MKKRPAKIKSWYDDTTVTLTLRGGASGTGEFLYRLLPINKSDTVAVELGKAKLRTYARSKGYEPSN
jgi:hypothetical protein